MSFEPIQRDLFEDVQLEHDDRTFGEWVESLPDFEAVCVDYPDAECRWRSSCQRDDCWRSECVQTGRPPYGIDPRSAP